MTSRANNQGYYWPRQQMKCCASRRCRRLASSYKQKSPNTVYSQCTACRVARFDVRIAATTAVHRSLLETSTHRYLGDQLFWPDADRERKLRFEGDKSDLLPSVEDKRRTYVSPEDIVLITSIHEKRNSQCRLTWSVSTKPLLTN